MEILAELYGNLRFRLVLPLHLLIALAVTGHALLRKRDVGAALGWIGLTWLAPFIGGSLYFVLGINRVKRRAEQLNRHPRTRSRARTEDPEERDDFEPLQRGIGRISRRALESGNALTIYQDGDEAYPAMLAAIDAARTSIGLSSYIMRMDETGTRFVEALKRASDRGVEVRVIVDGVGGDYLFSPAYHALRHAGIKAGRFMHSPLPWRMPLLNLRSHKKILVVDGRTGFTGGMNIANENVMAMRPKRPVQDSHFKITGPVVSQLGDAFADDWAFVSGEGLEGYAWFPTLDQSGAAKARVITSGPDQDLEKIEFSVMQAVACARACVTVMTPYFLPDERLLTALSLAAMRGVKVHVVMPKASNHVLVDWAARANIGSLLKDGVNVWLGPSPFRHSKIMVVDDEWSLIGSCNWDLRSFRLNFEICMEVYDQAFARKLQHFVMSNKGEPLTNRDLKDRGMPIRLRDAGVRLMMPYL